MEVISEYKLIHRRTVNNKLLQNMGIASTDRCLYYGSLLGPLKKKKLFFSLEIRKSKKKKKKKLSQDPCSEFFFFLIFFLCSAKLLK